MNYCTILFAAPVLFQFLDRIVAWVPMQVLGMGKEEFSALHRIAFSVNSCYKKNIKFSISVSHSYCYYVYVLILLRHHFSGGWRRHHHRVWSSFVEVSWSWKIAFRYNSFILLADSDILIRLAVNDQTWHHGWQGRWSEFPKFLLVDESISECHSWSQSEKLAIIIMWLSNALCWHLTAGDFSFSQFQDHEMTGVFLRTNSIKPWRPRNLFGWLASILLTTESHLIFVSSVRAHRMILLNYTVIYKGYELKENSERTDSFTHLLLRSTINIT